MQELNIDEAKAIELSILKTATDYLESHGLRYNLDFGTLLGAIRHKGFIPWDDDIDISVPRPDYEKFIELVKKEPLSDGLRLICDKETKCISPYAKIEATNTLLEEPHRYKKYKTGLFIDVFPVDGYIDDEQKRNLQNDEYNKLDHKRCVLSYISEKSTPLPKRIIKRALSSVLTPYSIVEKITAVQKRYSFEESPYGRVISGFRIKQNKVIKIDKSNYDDTIEVEFEGYMMKAPRNWDKRLTDLYGDYMAIPPENERVSHFVRAYKLDTKEL